MKKKAIKEILNIAPANTPQQIAEEKFFNFMLISCAVIIAVFALIVFIWR